MRLIRSKEGKSSQEVLLNTSSDRMRTDIYEHGETVAVVHSVESETIEAWVGAVRGWSEVPDIDWHYFGGRALVAALGSEEELEKVRKACEALLPSLHIMLPELYPAVYGGESGQVVCFRDEFKQTPVAGAVYPFRDVTCE